MNVLPEVRSGVRPSLAVQSYMYDLPLDEMMAGLSSCRLLEHQGSLDQQDRGSPGLTHYISASPPPTGQAPVEHKASLSVQNCIIVILDSSSRRTVFSSQIAEVDNVLVDMFIQKNERDSLIEKQRASGLLA